MNKVKYLSKIKTVLPNIKKSFASLNIIQTKVDKQSEHYLNYKESYEKEINIQDLLRNLPN